MRTWLSFQKPATRPIEWPVSSTIRSKSPVKMPKKKTQRKALQKYKDRVADVLKKPHLKDPTLTSLMSHSWTGCNSTFGTSFVDFPRHKAMLPHRRFQKSRLTSGVVRRGSSLTKVGTVHIPIVQKNGETMLHTASHVCYAPQCLVNLLSSKSDEEKA